MIYFPVVPAAHRNAIVIKNSMMYNVVDVVVASQIANGLQAATRQFNLRPLPFPASRPSASTLSRTNLHARPAHYARHSARALAIALPVTAHLPFVDLSIRTSLPPSDNARDIPTGHHAHPRLLARHSFATLSAQRKYIWLVADSDVSDVERGSQPAREYHTGG